ncbi:5833_t:CDS:1, partial [Paraglomus occultum]
SDGQFKKTASNAKLVVVGNGNGVGGYGEGKDEEAVMTIKKATNKAFRLLKYFERYNDRTVYHDIEYKFGGTRLKLFARPPGTWVMDSGSEWT